MIVNNISLPKLTNEYDEEQCTLTKNKRLSNIAIIIIYLILETFIFSAIILFNFKNNN